MMAREYGVGAADASLIITAGTLAVAATAPFTGALSDVLGRKRLIVAAMALLLIPATMTALAPSLQPADLLALRPRPAAAADLRRDHRLYRRRMAAERGQRRVRHLCLGVGGRRLPRPVHSRHADGAYVGWRGGFLALAGGSVICLAVVALLLAPERKFVRATNFGTSLRQMLAHLRNPRLLATYAVGFGVLFNFIATFTYLSFHLAAPPFNRSPAFLGSIFVVYLVGSAAALWLGRAIAWLGRRNFVLCVLAVWACGMLFSLIPSVTAIVFSLVIASTCGILTQASSTSFVAITAKTGTSAAVGLYVTSFYIGGTFGGWLPGLAYEAGGWPYSLALVIGMLAIMALDRRDVLEAVECER